MVSVIFNWIDGELFHHISLNCERCFRLKECGYLSNDSGVDYGSRLCEMLRRHKPAKYDSYYAEEEGVWCDQPGYEHRLICSGCKEEGHEQGRSDQFHDCKVIFTKGGKNVGQCSCYSIMHGMRGG